MKQEKEKQNVTLRELRVDSRLCYGDWIEGEGKGAWGRESIKLIMAYLLKCLDVEFEVKIILKSIFIFKYLQDRITAKISCCCMKDINTNQNLTPYY